MKTGSPPDQAEAGRSQPAWFAEAVRIVIAPLVLLSSGFFTADFLLSGVYTWPRTSRIVVLTITLLVLSYEFVYKEQCVRRSGPSNDRAVNAILFSCVIPYTIGALVLVALARLAS
ncbi:MAG TPA: hypothetical protein VFL31_05810 [Nitrospiraceae bacterium]|nr:hypothetical protein [Nitrospiraceae bacterium]